MTGRPPSPARAPAAEEAADRLARILGEHAAVHHDAGETTVEPLTEEGCARCLAACATNGWRTEIMGGGRWLPKRVPPTVRVSTRRFDTVPSIRAADLYATVGAGVLTGDLARELAAHGVWLPVEPPGMDRTVGSVLACATQGGLRTGFGGIRDHVLGLTVITGAGRVLRLGGRVVKNVAGFDLTKLVIGGFGAFGVVISAHLRLRATPARDRTLQTGGERGRLIDLAARVLNAGMTPAALELSNGDSGWCLSARLLGSPELVEAETAAMNARCDGSLVEMTEDAAQAWWRDRRAAAISQPTTLRVGGTMGTAAHALALVDAHPGSVALTFAFGGVTLRWNGVATIDELLRMRTAAAHKSMPVVVERAPPSVLSAVGHWGALPAGSDRLARSLQHVFDPTGTLSHAVWAS